jgi:hypothetical protein
VLRRVLLGGSADHGRRPLRVEVRDVRVSGRLRLDAGEFPGMLVFRRCGFPSGLSGLDLEIGTLILEDCTATTVDLGDLRTAGSLILRRLHVRPGGSEPHALRVSGASIAGSVMTEDLQVVNPAGVAVAMNRLRVGKVLALRRAGLVGAGIRAALYGRGLRVDGDVDLSGTSIVSIGQGPALQFDHGQIGGQLFAPGLHVVAGPGRALSLAAATVGTDVVLTDARLRSRDEAGLQAEQVVVHGSVVLSGARIVGRGADGAVRLSGATIGDRLDARGTVIENTDGPALHAGRAEVNGDIALTSGFVARNRHERAAVRLASAITPYLDLSNGTLANASGPALDLREAHIDAIRIPRASLCRLSPQGAPTPDNYPLLDGFVFNSHTQPCAVAVDWITWLQRANAQPWPGFSAQPYTQLASYYRLTGRGEDASRVAIARYQHYAQLRTTGTRERIFLAFMRLTMGHGYRPYRIVYFLAALFLASWAVVVIGRATNGFLPIGNTVPQGTVVTNCRPDYPCLAPAAYAFEAIAPILNLHQAEFWQPRATGLFGWLAAFLHLAAVLGWAGTTLAVSALIALVRSER